MIFAKVDVKLRDHEKAHRAGAAMATWTWALLYVRDQETDGFIPDVALRGAWVGEKEARKHAATLVSVGLWEHAEAGWRVCKYGLKNDTRESIAARRAEVRDRVTQFRMKRKSNSDGNALQAEPCNASVPGSRSRSLSVSDQDPEIQDLPGPTSDAVPDWFRSAVSTVSMNVAPVDDVAARWFSYRSSRKRKTWSMGHEDAVGWLSDVIRSERAKAAEAAEFRAAAQTRRDPPPPQRETPEQAREFARAITARLKTAGGAQ